MVISPTMSPRKTDISLQSKLYICANDVRVSSKQFKRNPYQEQESKRGTILQSQG